MNRKTIELVARLGKLGFSTDEALALRRIEMALQRWGEQECGVSDEYGHRALVRDEETGKPYWQGETYHRDQSRHVLRTTKFRRAVRDSEAAAQRRLDKIMAGHPELVAYHQGDCRGCNLYILRKADLNGSDIDQVYTRGLAVCD